MSLFPLDKALTWLIRYGRIEVIGPDGRLQSFGKPDATPVVTIRLHDNAIKWWLTRRPRLAVGEAYSSGRMTIERGTLREAIEILLKSADIAMPAPRTTTARIFRKLRHFARLPGVMNRVGKARDNVHRHYDIGNALYELFLDRDMQYSCAYFRDDSMTLDEAQEAKKQHLARKLLLQPGMRVFDIGCGWGGLAIHLARHHGVHVTGVTLSDEQFATATRRVREAGLAGRVEIKLQDYRLETGVYDRIVSVGMFEHVGQPFFRQYFDNVFKLLDDNGIAVIHTIARNAPPEPINAWIHRYIFPGAYVPSLSELAPILENRGLWLTDLENWRLHYAKTLRHWDARVQKHRAEIVRMFDERFFRMWEFYLQTCEAGFEYQNLSVFQMQLAKKVDAVPLTRDYITDEPQRAQLRSVGG